jgi:hypothetical protein
VVKCTVCKLKVGDVFIYRRFKGLPVLQIFTEVSFINLLALSKKERTVPYGYIPCATREGLKLIKNQTMDIHSTQFKH